MVLLVLYYVIQLTSVSKYYVIVFLWRGIVSHLFFLQCLNNLIFSRGKNWKDDTPICISILRWWVCWVAAGENWSKRCTAFGIVNVSQLWLEFSQNSDTLGGRLVFKRTFCVYKYISKTSFGTAHFHFLNDVLFLILFEQEYLWNVSASISETVDLDIVCYIWWKHL